MTAKLKATTLALYRCTDCGRKLPCFYAGVSAWKPEVCALTMRFCHWRRVGGDKR